VPLAIGSTSDILSRTIGAELAKRLVSPSSWTTARSRWHECPAAGCAAAPDGYTIALITSSTHAINIGLYSKPGYDPVRDFTPITVIGEVSNLMIVHPSNPAKTAQDVIAQQKRSRRAHVFLRWKRHQPPSFRILFASMAGIDLVHVPYKGAPQGITAVMSKEVTMVFSIRPR